MAIKYVSPKLRIGIIGSGTMGQALIRGLTGQGYPPSRLFAADPTAHTRRLVHRRFHLPVTADNTAVVRHATVIILAVKPQQFPEVLKELKPHLSRRHLVISIAAGITLRWLTRRLPGVPLVRVMPSLPATVGCGFAALAYAASAGVRHRAIARAIFQTVGEAVEVPERYFHAITAVSGSGPAYVLYVVQALEAAARSLGLPTALASQAVQQTLEGSARLLAVRQTPAAALIQQVASKRGTTEAALNVLAQRRVAAHLAEALHAAAARSRTLAQ